MASFLRCEGGHLAVLSEAIADGSVEWTPPAARESPAAAMIAAAAAATATVAPSARRLAVETRDAARAPTIFSATESLLARDGGHLAVLYEAEIEGSMSAIPITDVHESMPPAAARERPAAAEAASAAKPSPGANVGAREFTPSPETAREAKAKLRAAAAAAFDAARAPATEVRGVRASARDLEALAHQGLRAVASKLALTPATVKQLAKLKLSNQRRATQRLADRDVMSGVTDPNSFIVTDLKKNPTKSTLICADRLLAGLLGKPPARPEPAPASERELEGLAPALRAVAVKLALAPDAVAALKKHLSGNHQGRAAQRLADPGVMFGISDPNAFILADLQKKKKRVLLRDDVGDAAVDADLVAAVDGLRLSEACYDMLRNLSKAQQARYASALRSVDFSTVGDPSACILRSQVLSEASPPATPGERRPRAEPADCKTRRLRTMFLGGLRWDEGTGPTSDAELEGDIRSLLGRAGHGAGLVGLYVQRALQLAYAEFDDGATMRAALEACEGSKLRGCDVRWDVAKAIPSFMLAEPAPAVTPGGDDDAPASKRQLKREKLKSERRAAPPAGGDDALGRTVFVRGLPDIKAGEAAVRSWMAGCGAIASVELGHLVGQRRGRTATVVFETLAGAEAACDTLNGEYFSRSSNKITVNKSGRPSVVKSVAKAERPPVDGPERRLLEMERRLGERERRLSDETDALARRRLEAGRADAGAELADEVLELVDESPSGTILCANLPQHYKEKFGKLLDLKARGGAKTVLSRLPGVRFEGTFDARVSREHASRARAPAAAARERKPAPAPASDAKLRALAADVLALCDAAPSGALLCGDLPRLYGRAFGRPLDLGGMKMFALMSRLPGVQLARTPAGTEVSRPCLPAGAAVSRTAAVAPPPKASPSKAELKRRVAAFASAEGLDDGCRAALERYAVADADRCARFLRAAPSNLGDARDRAAFVLDAVERRASLAASARELAALAPELRDVADELALTSEVVATLAGLAPEDQTLVALALQSADLARVKNLTGFVLMGLKKGTLLRKGQKREAVRRSNGAPEEFLCPLTLELMRDPVIAADGHTYERAAIAAWLARKSTSPVTNERIVSHEVVPAHTIRSMIARFADGA